MSAGAETPDPDQPQSSLRLRQEIIGLYKDTWAGAEARSGPTRRVSLVGTERRKQRLGAASPTGDVAAASNGPWAPGTLWANPLRHRRVGVRRLLPACGKTADREPEWAAERQIWWVEQDRMALGASCHDTVSSVAGPGSGRVRRCGLAAVVRRPTDAIQSVGGHCAVFGCDLGDSAFALRWPACRSS